VANIIRTDTFE